MKQGDSGRLSYCSKNYKQHLISPFSFSPQQCLPSLICLGAWALKIERRQEFYWRWAGKKDEGPGRYRMASGPYLIFQVGFEPLWRKRLESPHHSGTSRAVLGSSWLSEAQSWRGGHSKQQCSTPPDAKALGAPRGSTLNMSTGISRWAVAKTLLWVAGMDKGAPGQHKRHVVAANRMICGPIKRHTFGDI